ncbi:MAG: transposase zinc-binding domain-containing protein, partial [Cyclobacteriaceae bacterium]|nr:transposase zinc-binding domain-containing protein [Cyclobacteriaceae bacterium]
MINFTVLKPEYEVADVIRLHGSHFEQQFDPSVQVRKTLRALSLCRTKTLGGHVTVCTHCGVESISYNSCRNRNCPKCQVTNKER